MEQVRIGLATSYQKHSESAHLRKDATEKEYSSDTILTFGFSVENDDEACRNDALKNSYASL